MLASEGFYQPDKYPQLDNFMGVFDKVFKGKDHAIKREVIKNLNDIRNHCKRL